MACNDNKSQEKFPLDDSQNEYAVRLRKDKPDMDDIEMLDLSTVQTLEDGDKSGHRLAAFKQRDMPMDVDNGSDINDMHKLIEVIEANASFDAESHLHPVDKADLDRFFLPLIQQIMCETTDVQMKLRAMRTIEQLTIKGYPILSYLIERQIVPLLVECLKTHAQPLLQVEAILSIINITRFKNSDFRKKIIYAGAVPLLIQLINAPQQQVSLKSLHALNALVFNEPQIREYVTRNGLTTSILLYLKSKPANSNLLMIVHHVSYFKGLPPPLPTVVPELLQIFNKVLDQPQIGLIYFALLSIKQLAHVYKYKAMVTQVPGLVPKLIGFFGHCDSHIQKTAIMIITSLHFLRKEHYHVGQCQSMLPYFPTLLTHRCKTVCRATMTLLAKLTSNNELQVQTLIEDMLLPKIIDILKSSAFEIQKLAIEVVHNLIENGDRQQIFAIIRAGVLQPYCNFLSCQNSDIVFLVLSDLNKMLEISDTHWLELANLIEECDGLDKIEALQYHENVRIYLLALDIIERYFSGETQQELSMQPKADSTQFYFDMNAGGDRTITFDF